MADVFLGKNVYMAVGATSAEAKTVISGDGDGLTSFTYNPTVAIATKSGGGEAVERYSTEITDHQGSLRVQWNDVMAGVFRGMEGKELFFEFGPESRTQESGKPKWEFSAFVSGVPRTWDTAAGTAPDVTMPVLFNGGVDEGTYA